MFTVTYRYTRKLLRRHYLRELWRTQGGWLLSLPLALAISIWASFDRDYSWFAGFVAGVSLTYAALLYSGYRQALKYRVDQLVNTTITDAGLHFDFASVSSDVPWNGIASIHETKGDLILTLHAGARPVLIPSEALSAEVSTFVTRKVRETRGRTSDGA